MRVTVAVVMSGLMRRFTPLRLVLIALIALFSGPRPAMAAAGEWVVICGADGAAKTVLYDFEAGAPAKSGFALERCDLCLACDMAAAPWAGDQSQSSAHAAEKAAPFAASLRASAAPPASARAPPVSV